MTEPTTSLPIRMPLATRERFSRAASMRQLTHAQYLERLLDLHDRMRSLADTATSDGRWEQVQTEIEALGLQTVTG